MDESSSSWVLYDERERPQQSRKSGSGNYCCIPTCKSTQYKIENSVKTNTDIGFFHFPKTLSRRRCWVQSVSRFRRKGGKDNFNVKNALLCEFHFKPEHVNVSIGQGRKTLKRNSEVFPIFDDLNRYVNSQNPKCGYLR